MNVRSIVKNSHDAWIHHLRPQSLPGTSTRADELSIADPALDQGWHYPTIVGPVTAPTEVPMSVDTNTHEGGPDAATQPIHGGDLPQPPRGGYPLDSVEGLLTLAGFGPSPLARLLRASVSVSTVGKRTAWIRQLPAPHATPVFIEGRYAGAILRFEVPMGITLAGERFRVGSGAELGVPSEELGKVAVAVWAWRWIRSKKLLPEGKAIQEEAFAHEAYARVCAKVAK